MSTRGFIGWKKDGKIQGWYNHSDSYPEGLGNDILKKFCMHTQEELRAFFASIILTDREEHYSEYRSIMGYDWGSPTNRKLKDASEFLKDSLSCEYGYVFDLDADEKTLMLFKGFGKSPTPGYEDYTYANKEGERWYTNLMGTLVGELDQHSAKLLMNMMFISPLAYKILETPDNKLLLLPALVDDFIPEDDEDPDETREQLQKGIEVYMEWRLKRAG